MDHIQERDLGELILKALTGNASDHQIEHIAEVVSNDPLAMDYYSEYISLYACLACPGSSSSLPQDAEGSQLPMDSGVALDGVDIRDVMADADQVEDGHHDPSEISQAMQVLLELVEYEKTAPAIEIPDEESQQELIRKVVYPPHQKRKVSNLNLFTLAVSAAAILFVVLFLKFTPEPLPSMAVATLVDQMNVQWGGPVAGFKNGRRLWTNDQSFNLKKGLLSIAYDQGVKVVVEGPALFEVERSGVFLEYGRIYSQVSEAATGFTVSTPTSQFVDMGTEFGVQADIDGSAELHVTKGKVQLFASEIGKTKIAKAVTEDKAVRYDANSGSVKDIRIKKNAFVRKINSAFNQAWKGPSPYEQAVLETRSLYYWRFDGDRQGLLRDEMNPRLNNEYKLFGSLGYSDGPDLGAGKNVAVRLTGSQDDYAILRDCTDQVDNADGFTIAAWIRPEKVVSDNNIIMRFRGSSGKFVGGGRSLWIDHKNRFGFYLTKETAMSSDQRPARSDPVAVNTWHHVVVAFTKNERISLYVNGKLQAREQIIDSANIHTESMQWCLGSSYSEKRASFEGSIDEISHHDRELSAEEVRTLYEAAEGRSS